MFLPTTDWTNTGGWSIGLGILGGASTGANGARAKISNIKVVDMTAAELFDPIAQKIPMYGSIFVSNGYSATKTGLWKGQFTPSEIKKSFSRRSIAVFHDSYGQPTTSYPFLFKDLAPPASSRPQVGLIYQPYIYVPLVLGANLANGDTTITLASAPVNAKTGAPISIQSNATNLFSSGNRVIRSGSTTDVVHTAGSTTITLSAGATVSATIPAGSTIYAAVTVAGQRPTFTLQNFEAIVDRWIAEGIEPGAILLQSSVNSISGGIKANIDADLARIEECAEYALARGIRVILSKAQPSALGAPYSSWTGDTGYWQHFLYHDQQVLAIAARTGSPVWDMWESIGDPARPYAMSTANNGDGTHPNTATGYPALAAALRDFVFGI